MGKTAAELITELANNKQFQKDKAVRDKKHDKFAQACQSDEAGLVRELYQAGFKVNSVWDFVNSSNDYIHAVPILIKHLGIKHHPKIIAGIARSLALPELAENDQLWFTLIDLYKYTLPDYEIESPEYRGLQEAIAIALETLATEQRLHSLEAIIRDNANGDGIDWLVDRALQLKKSKK